MTWPRIQWRRVWFITVIRGRTICIVREHFAMENAQDVYTQPYTPGNTGGEIRY